MPAHLTEAEFAKLKGATPAPAPAPTADDFHKAEHERRAAERHALDCELKRACLAKLAAPVATKLPRRVVIEAKLPARRPHWHGAALAFLLPVAVAILIHAL